MAYVDGFLIPLPKAKIEDYKEMARLASEVWLEHGATSYVECIGDDVPYGELTSFPRAVQLKDDEIVVFAWSIFDSKEARDAANKKIMEDPRLKPMMEAMMFDGKRMIFGGFETFLQR